MPSRAGKSKIIVINLLYGKALHSHECNHRNKNVAVPRAGFKPALLLHQKMTYMERKVQVTVAGNVGSSILYVHTSRAATHVICVSIRILR